MSYTVIPLVLDENGLNIPYSVMGYVWNKLEKDDKIEPVWYGGSVTDFRTFMETLFSGQNLPLLVAKDDEPVLLAWANGLSETGHAFGHFVPIGPYRVGVAKSVFNFWRSLRRPDGTQIIRVLLGITPETYSRAIRLAKLVGFKPLCTIPKLCRLEHENRTVGGVLTYYDLED